MKRPWLLARFAGAVCMQKGMAHAEDGGWWGSSVACGADGVGTWPCREGPASWVRSGGQDAKGVGEVSTGLGSVGVERGERTTG